VVLLWWHHAGILLLLVIDTTSKACTHARQSQNRKNTHSTTRYVRLCGESAGLRQACRTFCYCRPHYFYLYEVRPPMSSSYIYEILPSANQHRRHSNINWVFIPKYNSLWHHHLDCYASCQLSFSPCVCFASYTPARPPNLNISNYSWTVANFIIEGSIRPCGRRLCTVGLWQGCQTYGPRAKSGPLRGWIPPAGWFREIKIFLFAWEVYPVILQ